MLPLERSGQPFPMRNIGPTLGLLPGCIAAAYRVRPAVGDDGPLVLRSLVGVVAAVLVWFGSGDLMAKGLPPLRMLLAGATAVLVGLSMES